MFWQRIELVFSFFIIIVFSFLILSCSLAKPDSPSEPSNILVSNVKASRLEFTDKIRITWDNVPTAGLYKVYRYMNPSDTETPLMFTSASNVFDDLKTMENGASQNIPYYYRVSCIVGSTEQPMSANYTQGIYSSETDPFEPNDSQAEVAVVGSSQCFASIYSFQNGVFKDEDWYKYPYPGSDIALRITVNIDESLKDKLSLEMNNDGTVSTHILDDTENPLIFSVSGDLNFRIFINIADFETTDIGHYNIIFESL